MWRIFVAGVLIVAAMVAIKDGRVLRDAGLKASCRSSAPPAGQTGVWKRCTEGRLDGFPDLSRQGCRTAGTQGKLEWWRCPAAIGSSLGS